MRLKIRDSHLTCKVANKCLDVRERVEVVEWNKRWSLPFPCESSVSVKENPDGKKSFLFFTQVGILCFLLTKIVTQRCSVEKLFWNVLQWWQVFSSEFCNIFRSIYSAELKKVIMKIIKSQLKKFEVQNRIQTNKHFISRHFFCPLPHPCGCHNYMAPIDSVKFVFIYFPPIFKLLL